MSHVSHACTVAQFSVKEDMPFLWQDEKCLNIETMQDRWKVLLKHELETTVASSAGDVTSALKCLLAEEIHIPAIIDKRKKRV